MDELALFTIRTSLLQLFLQKHKYDGILIRRADNFAMATGGKRNYVSTYTDLGAFGLFVSRDGRLAFVGNNIEEPRALAEELADFGCHSISALWFEDNALQRLQNEFSGHLVSDDGSLGENVNGKLAVLRSLLTEAELEKYRKLGGLAAEAMVATLDQIGRGMTEAEVASILTAEGARRHCLMSVALVAADERIAQYRHPLPTTPSLLDTAKGSRPVEKYVMVVGGFMREGLVVSMTRFKQVDELPDSLLEAQERICGVDALIQEATQPGENLGEILQVATEAYEKLGFSEHEWYNHHQGGSTGYAGRTCKASPGETFPVLPTTWSSRLQEHFEIEAELGQAFAWNPSAPGVKSEDTFLLLPSGKQEIVTATPSLPRINLEHVIGQDTRIEKSGFAR